MKPQPLSTVNAPRTALLGPEREPPVEGLGDVWMYLLGSPSFKSAQADMQVHSRDGSLWSKSMVSHTYILDPTLIDWPLYRLCDSAFIARNKLNLHKAVLSGVDASAFLHTKEIFPLLGKEDAFIHALGVSSRTLSRYKTLINKTVKSAGADERLVKGAPVESLVQFASVMTLALEVFGDSDDAQAWMLEKCPQLEDQRPIDLLQTKIGADLVTNLLEQLKHGVYV